MTPNLFVYGTLMSTAASKLGRGMRARLQQEARLIGAAMIQGRLYDLGRYPVLVASDGAADVVHGEVYAIADPSATLSWLDDYEGIPASDEFQRIESKVRLVSHDELVTWVYRYQGSVIVLPRIASGRWQAKG